MRILLADDHTLFRDALVQYTQRSEPDITMNPAKDFDEAFKILQEDSTFDLVILDFKMPGMYNFEGLKKILKKFPDIPVAIMSGVAETEDVKKAIDLGAAGYLPKLLSGKTFMQAIRLIVSGQRYLPLEKDNNSIMPSYINDERDTDYSSNAQKRVKALNGLYDNGEPSDEPRLTPREKDVAKFLAQGASNKEIARELDLQVVTVKLHVSGLCRKLNAQNRTQAALRLQEMGLES